jgi:hypothetical protein
MQSFLFTKFKAFYYFPTKFELSYELFGALLLRFLGKT